MRKRNKEPSFLKKLLRIQIRKRNKNSPIHVPPKNKLIHVLPIRVISPINLDAKTKTTLIYVLPIRVGYNAKLEEQKGHGLVEVIQNTIITRFRQFILHRRKRN